MPGSYSIFHPVIPISGDGDLGDPAPADGPCLSASDQAPACSLPPPTLCRTAAAHCPWTTGAADIVPVHITPAFWQCDLGTHTSHSLHPPPSAGVYHCPAHAGGLQWPTPMGTRPTHHHAGRVSTHHGQPTTPTSPYRKVASPLRRDPTSPDPRTEWHPSTTAARPTTPCH